MENQNLTFGSAIVALKEGKEVSRIGWNGKGMYLRLVGNSEYGFTPSLDKIKASVSEYLPWIGMKTADDKFVPWLASQTDVLAEDWCVLA